MTTLLDLGSQRLSWRFLDVPHRAGEELGRIASREPQSPAGWLPATVPGLSAQDLLVAGRIPDPFFGMYWNAIRFFGGVPKLLDTYPDFRIKAEKLDRAITPKTKLILFNNPVNPTGIAYRKEEVAAIADDLFVTPTVDEWIKQRSTEMRAVDPDEA